MSVASTVEIITAIAGVIKTAVDLSPDIIKSVEDATPFAQAIYNSIKGTTITQDQLDQLEAAISNLSEQLQLPLDHLDDPAVSS